MNADLRRLSAEDVDALFESLPVGMALVAADGGVRAVNRRLELQLGRNREQLCGGAFSDLPLARSDHQTGEGQLMRVTEAEEFGTEWLMVIEGPQVSSGGEALEVRFFQDVTELEHARTRVDRLTQAMRGQVATDDTTGLLNRRAAMSQLEAQVSRSRRYHNRLSVVFIHVECSDMTSEGLSETVVLAVGRMLRDQTRWPDIIGRWGECEFLLILPETSAESADQLRGKIAEQLEQLEFADGGEPLRCSAEFGVAEWRKGDGASDLVRRAEEAGAVVD